MSSFFACAGHGRSRVGTARRGSPAPKRRQGLQRTAPRRAAGRRSGRGSPSATRGERRQRKAPARGARSGQVLQRAMQQPRLFLKLQNTSKTLLRKMLMHLTKVASCWIIDTWDDQNFRRRCRNSGSNSLPTPSVWSISRRVDGRMDLCVRSVAEAGIG